MIRLGPALLGAAALAAALAGSACGRYGPPLRAHEAAAARDESPPPPEITDPAVDPDDPVLPDETPEAP
jgi:hypothetical protein